MIFRSPEIETRHEFGALCNRQGCLRYAVEVGTDRAEFATKFREAWNGGMLLCIDPYLPYPEMDWDREADYQMAVAAMAKWPGRTELFRGTSQEAVDGKRLRWKPDFVYIDGAHDYESVKRDIELFWPQLTSCGILAGHDFDPEHGGVMQAVTEFAEREQVPVYLTREARFRSWYAYRTEEVLYGEMRIGQDASASLGSDGRPAVEAADTG